MAGKGLLLKVGAENELKNRELQVVGAIGFAIDEESLAFGFDANRNLALSIILQLVRPLFAEVHERPGKIIKILEAIPKGNERHIGETDDSVRCFVGAA